MKRDIETRDDLVVLVANFYDLLLSDETMAPIFIEVAEIDLETHLPHLVEFWYSLIFMTGTYRRNVMELHLALHLKVKLEQNHFEIWLKYFENSVRDLYEGPNSELAIERAKSIAQLMQHKIKGISNTSE
jgi:hemoglobin